MLNVSGNLPGHCIFGFECNIYLLKQAGGGQMLLFKFFEGPFFKINLKITQVPLPMFCFSASL